MTEKATLGKSLQGDLSRQNRPNLRRGAVVASALVLSMASLNGCGDGNANQGGNDSQGKSSNTSKQSTTPHGDNQQDLPIDVEGQSRQSDQEMEKHDNLAARLESLRQTVQTRQKKTQTKLHAQSERIDTLEQQVETLRKRVGDLKHTTTQRQHPVNNASGVKQAIDTGKPPKRPVQAVQVDALIEAATTSTSSSGSSSPDTNADSGATGSSQQDSANAGADDRGSGANAGDDPLAAAHCADRDNTDTGFDVAYKVSSDRALVSARRSARQAGITDWFTSNTRLYLGRYHHCAPAKRRRRQVYDQTRLVATLEPVRIQAPTKPNQAEADDTSTDQRDAPFRVVSVERHGRQQSVGVATGSIQSATDITWLYPGQHYRQWRLKTIRQAKGTATFADGRDTVTVTLPAQH